jgi:hypothetical protein
MQEPYNSAMAIGLLREYLQLCIKHPVPMRMIKGHVHKLIHHWLSEYHDLRDIVNRGGLSAQGLLDQVVEVLDARVKESGRTEPVPKLTDRQAKRMEQEAAKQAAIEEQEREAAALAALDAGGKGEGAGQAGPSSACLECDDVPSAAVTYGHEGRAGGAEEEEGAAGASMCGAKRKAEGLPERVCDVGAATEEAREVVGAAALS